MSDSDSNPQPEGQVNTYESICSLALQVPSTQWQEVNYNQRLRLDQMSDVAVRFNLPISDRARKPTYISLMIRAGIPYPNTKELSNDWVLLVQPKDANVIAQIISENNNDNNNNNNRARDRIGESEIQNPPQRQRINSAQVPNSNVIGSSSANVTIELCSSAK